MKVHRCTVFPCPNNMDIDLANLKEKALLGQMWEGPGERLSIAFSGGIES